MQHPDPQALEGGGGPQGAQHGVDAGQLLGRAGGGAVTLDEVAVAAPEVAVAVVPVRLPAGVLVGGVPRARSPGEAAGLVVDVADAGQTT